MVARFSEDFKPGKFTTWGNIRLAETRLSTLQKSMTHFRFT